MGMMSSPTAQVILDGAHVPAEDLVGAPGDGFRIAMQALDAGRLGIAACAVGLARGALDEAVALRPRAAGLRPVDRGVPGSAVHAGRHGHPGARRPRAAARGRPAQGRGSARSRLPAARAKLLATDVAMRVTTDAVQVLGGAGYTTDFPVERYMREAKVLQIVEGTNQIQRVVIGRALARG